MRCAISSGADVRAAERGRAAAVQSDAACIAAGILRHAPRDG